MLSCSTRCRKHPDSPLNHPSLFRFEQYPIEQAHKGQDHFKRPSGNQERKEWGERFLEQRSERARNSSLQPFAFLFPSHTCSTSSTISAVDVFLSFSLSWMVGALSKTTELMQYFCSLMGIDRRLHSPRRYLLIPVTESAGLGNHSKGFVCCFRAEQILGECANQEGEKKCYACWPGETGWPFRISRHESKKTFPRLNFNEKVQL